MDMDWQNNEFEALLRKFRLREARPLTPVQPVGIRRYRVKIAVAAAVVLAIGASAIVRQRTVKNDTLAIVEAPPIAIETPAPVARIAAAAPIPPLPQEAKTSSAKLDPKAPEPLKQLTVVIPAEPQDAGPLSTQVSPQEAAAEENKGYKAFLTACGSCHSVDLVQNSHFDMPQEYAAIIDRMVSIGATVSPQEAAAIAEYLFKTYGKKSDRPQDITPDILGRTVFNAACGSCHATDLMDSRKDADKETYRSIVNRMIAYGASVAPDQIDSLVEYLFRTYGRRPLK
jgi:mono/diheme cytochrome c family protein